MSSTKKFKWVDRDTVAFDLLQLTYYGPPYVSVLALNLQSAIRSNVISSELETISLDSDRSEWERRYAIRGLAAIPESLYFPKLSKLMQQEIEIHLANQAAIRSRYPMHENKIEELFYTYLGEVCGAVKKHPSNLDWFIDNLKAVKEPLFKLSLLVNILSDDASQEVVEQIDGRLSVLFQEHPKIFDLDVVMHIRERHDMPELQCLKERLEAITKMVVEDLASNTQRMRVYFLLRGWEELEKAVFSVYPSAKELMILEKKRLDENRTKKQASSLDYKTTEVYKRLEILYTRASDGDTSAFGRLVGHTRKWDGHLATRALATHFVGWLYPKYEVVNFLSHLLHYADDDWGTAPYYSPIRTEAGNGLRRIATPEAWEALINGFFVEPRNILQGFMLAWILNVTDALSSSEQRGETLEQSIGDIAHRPWMGALANIGIKDAGLEDIS